MNCKRAHELISLHLDEQLDPAGQGRLNGHLESCDECTTYLDDLREGLEALRGIEMKEPSANFDWNLRRKLQQAQHEPWRFQEAETGRAFWPRFTLAAAAALLLTLGGAYGVYQMMLSPSPPQLSPRNGSQAAGSLDIPALPQPYPGAAAEGERDLQVVGQSEYRAADPLQHGTIERTESGNSLPPLMLKDAAADQSDSLATPGEGETGNETSITNP